MLDDDRPTAGATPVPVSDTCCGLPAALSVIVRVPLADPVAVGVKVTLTVQLAPAASVAPQLLLSANVPVTAIELIVRLALPVLETVTVCAVLLLFNT
jgi:hypothetical protein